MVEVFTKSGTHSHWCKDHIWKTCGPVPAIYGIGTHYETNMRLTCDILKELSEFDFVIEISVDHIGAPIGTGAPYEHRGPVST